MGYTKRSPHSLTIGFSASNPVDATTYYFASTGLPLAAAAAHFHYFRMFNNATLLTRTTLGFTCDAGSSDEVIPIYVRTEGANTLLGNATKHSGNFYYLDSVVNVPIIKNGYISFLMITPSWVTNPTSLGCIGIAEFSDR